MKNTKRKSLALLLSLVVLSGVASVASTYAWWNTLTYVHNETVNLGEGVAVEVDVNLTQDKVLVPAGHLVNSATQTEKVTLTYDVGFSSAVTETFSLSVVESDVQIDGAATYADLVNIVIDAPATVDNAGALVTVEVTLDEPADEAEYDAVAGKDITFKLTFTTALV